MSRLIATIRASVADFRRDERGNISIELVTLVPLMAVFTFGLITFFDAFRAKSTAARTATVLSDIVSRETNAISPDFLNGLQGVMVSMIDSDESPEYRLTAFTWNQTAQEYRVRWSRERGNRPRHTKASLNLIGDNLPTLKDGQRAVLLETWVDYEPLTRWGLEEGTTFHNKLVAAQRFVPQICWMTDPTADPTTAVC